MIELPTSADPEIYGPAISWWTRTSKELGRLPSRADFDPTDISPETLRHVILVEIIGLAEDMRFRLLGTIHDQFNGRNLAGQYFSAVYPSGSPILAYIKGLYVEMINARRPLWSLNELLYADNSTRVRFGRLMLPLSNDGGVVDMCLAIQKIIYPDVFGETERSSWMNGASPSERERLLL